MAAHPLSARTRATALLTSASSPASRLPGAVIGIAGQRLLVADELAALAVLEGGGNAHLDAERVRPMSLAVADAFDFWRVQGIETFGPR